MSYANDMAPLPLRPLLSFGALVVLFSMSGCMNSRNDRSYLGVTPPASSASPDAEPIYDHGNGLDRDAWAGTTVHVPVDGTAHRPTYNSSRRPTQATKRQRGEMPTSAIEALELGDDTLAQQMQEVPIALGSAAIDAVSIPVGLVAYHQGKTRWSPDVSYERTRGATAAPQSPQLASGAPANVLDPTPMPEPARQQVPMGTMTPVETAGAPSE